MTGALLECECGHRRHVHADDGEGGCAYCPCLVFSRATSRRVTAEPRRPGVRSRPGFKGWRLDT